GRAGRRVGGPLRAARAPAAALHRPRLWQRLHARGRPCRGGGAVVARPSRPVRRGPRPHRRTRAPGRVDVVTRIGLIGLGAMGRNHLRVLEDLDGVELAAVCDLDASTANEVARRHSVHAYGSWDEMLDREKLDAVVVAVPTGLHLEAGLAVLRRGAHVLIEKPIAAGLEEGRRLVAEPRRAARVLAAGYIG